MTLYALHDVSLAAYFKTTLFQIPTVFPDSHDDTVCHGWRRDM